MTISVPRVCATLESHRASDPHPGRVPGRTVSALRNLFAFTDLAALDGAERDVIAPILGAQRTLEDVVRWGFASRPPRLVKEVVVQNEFTNDVVVRYQDGVYLGAPFILSSDRDGAALRARASRNNSHSVRDEEP